MTTLALLAASAPPKIVFAVLLAAAVLAFGLAMLFMSPPNKRGNIEERLGDLAPDPTGEVEEFNPHARPDQVFAETAVLKRMVGLTGMLADRAGLLSRTEDALERADLPLRPPEALFFYFTGVFVVALLGVMLFPPGARADPRRGDRDPPGRIAAPPPEEAPARVPGAAARAR